MKALSGAVSPNVGEVRENMKKEKWGSKGKVKPLRSAIEASQGKKTNKSFHGGKKKNRRREVMVGMANRRGPPWGFMRKKMGGWACPSKIVK